MSSGGAAEGAEYGAGGGGAVMFGSMDDTEGSVVTPAVAVAVAGGGGTAAAPGVGVGLGSAMLEVTSVFTLFGKGELGSEGGMC